ncbi:plasmid replication/partition related protein [Sphaerotilus mobilis]|uniref:Plasmid replication/partition related protein n=1 Tax=Sphaerotilus mobilis TaxID=47994 RepID=A0A4Q7LRK2_9BURK|nr:plasmid replication/partition related protein [Sphaerotilus mobilis]RZS56993.1 hypothetical protein EV685_1551 [Sphaerotilus mobilis]
MSESVAPRIVIDPEIQAYIDPLTPDEHDALERSLVTEGCRDALVLWGELLVDGHNRYGICQKHGLPFQTVQNTRFRSVEDVKLWMIEQHLGRRSLTDFQRGELALRQRQIVAARREKQLQEAASMAATTATSGATDDAAPWDVDGAPPPSAEAGAAAATGAPIAPSALKSREELARAARLSPAQVAMIEKIHQQAAPEVVAAVRAGDLSISAAAAVATLPAEEQVAAASGGKDELKQAAKRAREARRKPKDDASDSVDAAVHAPDSVEVLRARIAELEAENAALKQQLARLQAG